MLKIDLVPHMDAGDKNAWRGDQDERPLTELGRRQAAAMASTLATEPADALYASPALRCRQTLEPLAERFDLTIEALPEVHESGWRRPEGWSEDSALREQLVGSYAAGRALAGIERVRAEGREGRAVVCSHGHVIPALVAFLAARYGLDGIGELTKRGPWYRVRFEPERVDVELMAAPLGFP